MTFNITKHHLVSKHTKASDSEKKALFEKYNIDGQALPKILKDDPAIAHLSIKTGDIIKIERASKTAGISYYYRVVVGE